MSRANPTQKEAEEAYYSYKKRYEDAAHQKRASERQENEFVSQRNNYYNQISGFNSQKINFEKRIHEIAMIIAMLKNSTNNDGVLSLITQTNKELEKTENAFKGAVSPPSSLPSFKALRVPDVTQDPDSNNALVLLEKEKIRLEQALADINAKLNNARSQIEELTKRINQCNATQQSLSSTMMSSAYEMDYYKKKILNGGEVT